MTRNKKGLPRGKPLKVNYVDPYITTSQLTRRQCMMMMDMQVEIHFCVLLCKNRWDFGTAKFFLKPS
jgi:hypothetical protein